MDTTTPDLPTSFSTGNSDSRGRPDPVPARFDLDREDVPADAGNDAVARVVDKLHSAIDGVADEVAPMVNRLKGASEDASDLPRQWTDAARTVIRQKPIVVVSGALLVGAALLHLVSSSRR
jgi:hypothetical protein